MHKLRRMRHRDACTLPFGRLTHILGGARKPDPYHYVRTYCGRLAVDSEESASRVVTCATCIRVAEATG